MKNFILSKSQNCNFCSINQLCKRSSVYKIYSVLLDKFGKQGWWPLTKKGGVKPVYTAGRYKPKSNKEKLEVCIGAILTQNTAWINVEKALINLNKAKLLSAGKLARINPKTLQKLIRQSGYYVQKSKKIKIFARFLKTNFGGNISKLFTKKTDDLRNELLSLWGIGAETADSILLYAARKPVFVIDAYTARIAVRMGWFKKLCYEGMQKFFEMNLPKKIEIYNEFHALLVLLGKNYCKPKPLCAKCPIVRYCKKIGVGYIATFSFFERG